MLQQPTLEISGIYEVCIGVDDPVSAIQYWSLFGYRIHETGQLSADQAKRLYGVNSELQSIRLAHAHADHGWIRLMVWHKTAQEGWGLGSMKVKGNRWATTLTNDILNILNHVEAAANAGLDIKYTHPHWEVIYNKARKSRPFFDPAIGVREMLLLQPLSRQVLFQRFGYTMPHYGSVDENAPWKTSQFTHMGLVIQDDSKETLRFYEAVLGLLRVRDDVETSYESSLAGQEIFDLQPGELFFVTAFDEPRSSAVDSSAVRSGRLYIIRFPEAIPIPSQFEQFQPGCLGMCLYTYRVGSLENFRDLLQASTAQNLTPIVSNEFGEKSLSFQAPDGYFWTLLEDR
ncbi:MAG TPA: VOC family protein [Stenomitos sp.]